MTPPGQPEQALTDSFVGIRRTRDKFQNLGPLLSQAPAIKDFSIALLKVIELLSVGRIQEPRGINRVVIHLVDSESLWLQSSSQRRLRNQLSPLEERHMTSHALLKPC